jgi:catechol 2,3-dioxygenase-like lactoylglutathione lyase family enzyme
MPDQTTCRNTGIHHVGLHATHPTASAEFYRDVLGMEVVGGSGPDGNMIEVYWPTGDLRLNQPQVAPLDLSLPDDVLLQEITA